MPSDATRMIAALGGEVIGYRPKGGAALSILGIVDRSRPEAAETQGGPKYARLQIRLTVANDATEGVTAVTVGEDLVECKADVDDEAVSIFRVTGILSQDKGLTAGDGGMWHLELTR
ncbi:hypothetical protein [Candidatus Nitrospira bockiana]